VKYVYAILGGLSAAGSVVAVHRVYLAFTENDLTGPKGQTTVFASFVALALVLAFSISCFRSAFAKPESSGKQPPGDES
jgi:hypothetical protein